MKEKRYFYDLSSRKQYTLEQEHATKTAASKHAETLRKGGVLARVTGHRGSWKVWAR